MTTSRLTVARMIALCVTLPAAAVGADDAPQPWRYTSRQMGVDVSLTLYAGREDVANVASEAAFARIAELNQIFSDYDADSEAMRLCRAAVDSSPHRVSPELFHVLTEAARLAERSEGAFDVTVGPLTKLWRRARRRVELPEPALLAATRERVGWKLVQLSADGPSVRLLRPDLQLDFGGIVKGYAADEALAVLRRHGITRAMVAIAGDIFAGDAPPDATGWRVRVAPYSDDETTAQMLLVTNQAVSTSGDAFQFVEIDGVRYSHIVDPRTGVGLTRRSQVTVVAPQGIAADSLATAASILGPEAGLRLIEQSQAAGFFVTVESGIVQTQTSGNWKREFLESRATPLTDPARVTDN